MMGGADPSLCMTTFGDAFLIYQGVIALMARLLQQRKYAGNVASETGSFVSLAY